jgi:phosphocarrier protein
MIERTMKIENQLGLHARAAAKLVHLANQYQSDLFIKKDGQQVNGKSIMGILLLAAAKGSRITLVFEGEDEEKAAKAVCGLIREKFGEN